MLARDAIYAADEFHDYAAYERQRLMTPHFCRRFHYDGDAAITPPD
jgi:hypothetical protein